jgi:MFS family permease
MPREGYISGRGHRALDLVNFFVADAQTGFGPFVAVYLTTHKWTQVEIGFALSLGTVTALISQLPAGALVDVVRNKRFAACGAVTGIMIAALLLALWPVPLPVLAAQMLQAFASCVLTPSIAAMSLALAGHAGLAERLGRNARFASVGNGLAAAVMGATGSYLSSRAVFLLTASLCVPALWALLAVGRGQATQPRDENAPRWDMQGLRRLVSDRRLLVFSACVALFHLSNAAMLPLAGAAVTMRAGSYANLIIAACIMVPQAVVALLSPWVGRSAERFGRRRLLLLGWAALPIRGLLLAVLPGSWPLIIGQAVSGISGAVFGVMLPLLAADLTRGTSHYNLCMGMLGLAMYLGAAISTSLGGEVADVAGMHIAFGMLAFSGLIGTVLVWLAMPETRVAPVLEKT